MINGCCDRESTGKIDNIVYCDTCTSEDLAECTRYRMKYKRVQFEARSSHATITFTFNGGV
jgi:hypothetical protein